MPEEVRAGSDVGSPGNGFVGRTSSAFRSAFRVMLYGVALSAAAIMVLPWGLARTSQTAAVSPTEDSPLPPAQPPAEDLRRIAAAEPLPGLYSSDGSTTALAAPASRVPAHRAAVSEEAGHGSRPVPFPRMAEADDSSQTSIDGAGQGALPTELGTPRAFPRGGNDAASSSDVSFPGHVPASDNSGLEPVSEPGVASGMPTASPQFPPLQPSPEILELRREVDRLSESHLRDQKEEIQKAQQILVEMQTAKQIDLLRDQIGLLREQQAETHRVAIEAASKPAAPAVAPPLPPPPPPPAVPAKEEAGPLLPKPIEIEPAAEKGRYTIRLRHAPLNVALNEVATLAGWNVVTGPEFSGEVTATLTDVAPEEAIDAILRVHGWRVRREGKFLLIERSSAAASPDAAAPAAVPDPNAATGELRTQVFQLHHVPAPAVLPHLQPLLTPQVGQASSLTFNLEGTSQVAQTGHDRVIVRDNPAALEKISGLVSQLDLPPRQIELETVILQIERPGRSGGTLKESLAAYIDSQAQGDLPCPRCGRRHRVAAAVDPACVLPKPEWTTAGGAGWEFAQLRGAQEEFLTTVKKIARAEVVARPRIRIANQQPAEIGMTGLVGQRSETVIQTAGVQLVNAGPLLSVRPHLLDSGEVRLHIDSRGELESGTAGTDIVVQKDCSLVIAGLQAEQTLPPANGFRGRVVHYEIVVLLTPRAVP